MGAVKVSVRRVGTTRDDETKYEHFVTIHNVDGQTLSTWMHFQPERALFEATDLATFLGVPLEPFKIDGVVQELSEMDQTFLEFRRGRDE